MTTAATTSRKPGWDVPRAPSWPQFAAWMIVGPLGIAGVLAAFTPLILITGPLTALLVLAIGRRGGFNASILGAISGLGVIPLVVACANRSGRVLSPWPWVALGIGIVGLGIGMYLVLARRAR